MRKTNIVMLSEVISVTAKLNSMPHNEACRVCSELELGQDGTYYVELNKGEIMDNEYDFSPELLAALWQLFTANDVESYIVLAD